MPRLTDKIIPLATIKAPDIMDGLHTYELQQGLSSLGERIYRCRHCESYLFMGEVAGEGADNGAA